MIPGLAAACLALAWAVVHTVLGGREIARPLRTDTTLPQEVRATAWMCWHMVTAVLFTLPVLLAWGTLANRPDFVLVGGLMTGALALAGILAAPLQGVSYRMLPQGWLFVPIAVLAWVAL